MANSPNLNNSQAKRLEFWNRFNEVIEERGKPFNKRKATTDHWYSVAIGSSDCHISVDLVNRDHKIRVGLWIADSKDLFDRLYAHKQEIETNLGMHLNWDRLDNKKASVICTYISGLDFNDQSNYDMLMNQTIDTVLKLRQAFANFVN